MFFFWLIRIRIKRELTVVDMVNTLQTAGGGSSNLKNMIDGNILVYTGVSSAPS